MALLAAFSVGYTGMKRATPVRVTAARPARWPQTSKTGTSARKSACQRALIKTDHADSSATCSSVTLTITADGCSSVALVRLSRSSAELLESSAPSAVKMTTESCVRTAMASAVGDLAAVLTATTSLRPLPRRQVHIATWVGVPP
ncbi:Uncharacterised protein [Mycobacterium tuberculosis]|nr:Uncharacterised protein [Mycobacterium tuberculosis]CKV04016.1 Uncharacterised protein [Mycobacterium tuberculosis]CNW18290.1 Uncharacterised protein [Mycobacterium tuberculosis]